MITVTFINEGDSKKAAVLFSVQKNCGKWLKLSTFVHICTGFFIVNVDNLWYNMHKRIRKILVNLIVSEITENGGASMDERARNARNAYRRAWYKKNRELVRQQQERYWNKKAAALEEEPQTEEQS